MRAIRASLSAYTVPYRLGLRRLDFESFVEGIYEYTLVGARLIAQELCPSHHYFVSVCCKGIHGLLQELVEWHGAGLFAAIEQFRAYPWRDHLKHADTRVAKFEAQRLRIRVKRCLRRRVHRRHRHRYKAQNGGNIQHGG